MNPGAQLAGGRYVLESRITRSGMGEVWLARQQGGGVSKTVVVKMIHPDLNAHREAQQRFFDEAQIVARINHPHVVQFYEFGEQDNMLYQVMEYIEGYAFTQITEQAKSQGQEIPLPVICRLLADAAQGLGHIHDMADDHGNRLELVHRDISPQNLLVSKTGTLKIIDFGIVKAKQKTSRTRTGVIVGKLQYMSPEQLSSEELDHRSDIYSLGLVLYEMLTLESRFRGSNLLEIFYEAFNEPLPQIVNIRPDCPPALVECVHRALAQEKENRFSHGYDMQDLLERYLHQQGSPCNQRDVSAYLSNLFAGQEHVRAETTRIHAASLLAEFQQTQGDSIDEDTLAANIAELDDLGDLDGMDPLDGTMISPSRSSSSNQRLTSSPHTLSSVSSVQEDYSPHTLASGQSALPASGQPSFSGPSHTLKGMGVDAPATHQEANTQRWMGSNQSSPWTDPTTNRQQTALHTPNGLNAVQDVTNPGQAFPMTQDVGGPVSEETVVLSTALMKDLERSTPSSTNMPATPHPTQPSSFVPPTIHQPKHPPPPQAPPPAAPKPKTKTSQTKAKAKAKAKKSQPQAPAAAPAPSQGKSTIFIGMGLGFVAFLLGIFLVYFFMGR